MCNMGALEVLVGAFCYIQTELSLLFHPVNAKQS